MQTPTSTATERDNRMVWDGRPGHYEVWYLTTSHRSTETGFWIRFVLEAPRAGQGDAYAQLWFSRFDPNDRDGGRNGGTFGVNKKYPIGQLTSTNEPFTVEIGPARLRHDGMSGSIEGEGHAIRWDLSWTPGSQTLQVLPAIVYGLPFVDSKVASPNINVGVRGYVEVDGRRYDFDGEPGGQTHVWGRKHLYQWAWSHCNAFDNAPGALFESISAKIKRGQVILPTITMFTLHLDGEQIAVRDPWTLPLARSTFQTGSYHLIGSTADTRVEAQLSCRAEDTLLAEYLDPDGDPAFNHISCCADASIIVKKRSPFVGRFRDHRTLLSRRLAHFEWGARAGDIVKVRKVLTPIE